MEIVYFMCFSSLQWLKLYVLLENLVDETEMYGLFQVNLAMAFSGFFILYLFCLLQFLLEILFGLVSNFFE